MTPFRAVLYSPANKMQEQTETFGAPPSLLDPDSRAQKAVLCNATTYLAKIAIVLQDAPEKMLTFSQLMDKLTLLFSEDRKSIENNIRVCLTTNKCFIKVPVLPRSLNSKRNSWKFDSTQITPKMARRHFRDILHVFPNLASKVQKENVSEPPQQLPAPNSSELEARSAVRIQREVKFRGPFSIDSLLKSDDHSAQEPRASPPSTVRLRVEQQHQQPHYAPCTHAGRKRNFSWEPEKPLILQSAAITPPIYSAEDGRYFGCGAVRPMKRMPAYTVPIAFPKASPPYFTPPHGSFITSVPTFPHGAQGFWL